MIIDGAAQMEPIPWLEQSVSW